MKKHPQHILAADADYFLRMATNQRGVVIKHDPKQFLQDVQSHLVIRERENLDNAPNALEGRLPRTNLPRGNKRYRQLLPYHLFYTIGPDDVVRYSAYQRTKKVGESRLAGKVSIGYGGHMDLADVVHENSVINLERTIYKASARELDEEVELLVFDDHAGMSPVVDGVFDERITYRGLTGEFILDHTDVGILHAGMVCAVKVHHTWGVRCKEEELQTLGFFPTDYLLSRTDWDLEPWTRAYLEYRQQAA